VLKRCRQRRAKQLIEKIAKRMSKDLGKNFLDPFDMRDAYVEKYGMKRLARRFDFCSIIM
jgi:hypothetical protein